MNLKESIKIKETIVFGCIRCEITSETEGRMCPCPRGGCEAEIIGTKIPTKEIKLIKNGF